MKFITFSILFVLTFSCQTNTSNMRIEHSNLMTQYNFKKFKDFKNWHFKDIELDSIPGISLNRAYNSILIDKVIQEKIIVAIIDSEIDINHKDLKPKIWINPQEIPNNTIDDDNNGYIDDIHGWNFLRNSKGQKNKFVNFEITRYLKKLTPYFQNKDTLSLNSDDEKLFKLYNKIKKRYDELLIEFMTEKQNDDLLHTLYFGAKKKLDTYFVNKPYNIKDLDSLSKLGIKNITETDFLVLIECLENNINDDYVINEKTHTDNIINKIFNLSFNDRITQGDNSEDIRDTDYGSNIINGFVEHMNHGTLMAGVIHGVNQNDAIEIMSLPISAYGDEHDKDIALAIRYAVDNGAKVINMSFYKEYSLHKEWVFDAFKYAEKNNVLIVGIAGNSAYNLNSNNTVYPNDNINNSKAVSDNFIMIGASTNELNENLISSSSSYGNIDVDLFAPGVNIATTLPNDKYTTSGGTSSAAAVTSGVAALVRSYYPNLSASQVKHILMDSGLEYTFNVSVADTLLPFNSLSKSGKVLNAYNALIMADSIDSVRR